MGSGRRVQECAAGAETAGMTPLRLAQISYFQPQMRFGQLTLAFSLALQLFTQDCHSEFVETEIADG